MDARALVIGAGSIGMRHQRVLEGLGLRTEFVSRRPASGAGDEVKRHLDLDRALEDFQPSHVVIATETSAHPSALNCLARRQFNGTVLVEKPVAMSAAAVSLCHLPFRALAVGYQLRFHPSIVAGRRALAEAQPLTIEASVGQHLSNWRPGRNIGETASARVEDGGGVLRDLSHEFDLVYLLAGDWRRVCALGGRSGALGLAVATDDRWAVLIEFESGAVATVNLDALDRLRRRRLNVVTADRTVAIDLVSQTVTYSGPEGKRFEQHTMGRDEVLADMHAALLDGASDARLCSFEEGLEVLGLIDAIEHSVRSGGWVAREYSRDSNRTGNRAHPSI